MRKNTHGVLSGYIIADGMLIGDGARRRSEIKVKCWSTFFGQLSRGWGPGLRTRGAPGPWGAGQFEGTGEPGPGRARAPSPLPAPDPGARGPSRPRAPFPSPARGFLRLILGRPGLRNQRKKQMSVAPLPVALAPSGPPSPRAPARGQACSCRADPATPPRSGKVTIEK